MISSAASTATRATFANSTRRHIADKHSAKVLSINSSRSVHQEAPFGGYKRSGIGRELGMHALQLYTEIKNVFVSLE